MVLCRCNWVKNLEMRQYWVVQVGPKSDGKSPYKRQRRRSPRHRGKGWDGSSAVTGLGDPGATGS